MLADDKIIQLWGQLANQFNVLVRSIGTGLKGGNECTVVTVDDKTDPAVIKTLPQTFANEDVIYETGAAVSAYVAPKP